jgi:hypothetical protein
MCPVSKRLNVPSGGYDDPSLIVPVEMRPVGHIKLAATAIAIAVPSVTVHHAGTTADLAQYKNSWHEGIGKLTSDRRVHVLG